VLLFLDLSIHHLSLMPIFDNDINAHLMIDLDGVLLSIGKPVSSSGQTFLK
jgi:hypothetical protein